MLTKSRLEAFSDGVFAIAITLLVIEIRPPELEAGESLAHGLWEQWPNYLAYVLSFLVLGVMWLNHHRIFEPARRIDGIVLVLNLNLLLWAVLVPFPTAVVADFLRDGGSDAKTAVGLYGGVILLAAISSPRCSSESHDRASWMSYRRPTWCVGRGCGSASVLASTRARSRCHGCRPPSPSPLTARWPPTT